MTRKQLEDLGLTKEQADSVMKINGDDIENAKGTASTEIKNLQTEVEGLKTQVGDRDKQLETLKLSLIHIPSPRDRTRSRMPSSA